MTTDLEIQDRLRRSAAGFGGVLRDCNGTFTGPLAIPVRIVTGNVSGEHVEA